MTEVLEAEIRAGHGQPLCLLARGLIHDGRPLTDEQLLAWIISGIQVEGGARVRLEAAKKGGTMLSTRTAIVRFFSRIKTPNLDDEAEVEQAVPVPAAV